MVETIHKTENGFVVDGMEIPRLQKGKLNIYKPEQIKAIGADLFLDLVARKTPVSIPDFEFSEAELKEMDKILAED
jgi:hypothetical protein